MPHYDFECAKCGHKFEAFQKITDQPLKKCPECKGKLNRLIGAGIGLIFKGSGFYATDYKRSNNKEASCDKKDCSSSESKKNPCPCNPKSNSQECPKNSDSKK